MSITIAIYKEFDKNSYMLIQNFYSGYPYYLTIEAKYADRLNIVLKFDRIKDLIIENVSLIENNDINHISILTCENYELVNISEEIKLSYIIKRNDTNS